MSPSIWALVTTAFARTAVPSSASAPAAGTVTIFTLASAAPVSVSAKPKSSASKVYAAPTPVVTVLLAAVGAVLAAAPLTLWSASVPTTVWVSTASSPPTVPWIVPPSSLIVRS